MAKKLLDRLRDKIRAMHYSPKTEDSYVSWVKRFILFHHKRHPQEMGKVEIEAFLTYLAVKKKVSLTTQNQAFHAILFLYEKVLNINLKDENIQALRAKQRIRIHVVLTESEVGTILDNLTGIYQLIVKTMYGCGLRLNEVLDLRLRILLLALIKLLFGTPNHWRIAVCRFHKKSIMHCCYKLNM